MYSAVLFIVQTVTDSGYGIHAIVQPDVHTGKLLCTPSRHSFTVLLQLAGILGLSGMI